jgi:hypothetical protein
LQNLGSGFRILRFRKQADKYFVARGKSGTRDHPANIAGFTGTNETIMENLRIIMKVITGGWPGNHYLL